MFVCADAYVCLCSHNSSTLVLSTAAYAVCLFVPHYVSILVLSTDTYDTYAVCLFVPHYVSILVLSMAPYAVCLFVPSLR